MNSIINLMTRIIRLLMIIHFDITGGGQERGRDFESAWDKENKFY